MNQKFLTMKMAFPMRRRTTHKYSSADMPKKTVSFRDEVSQGTLTLSDVYLVESYKALNQPANNCLNCACNLL